MRIRFNVDQGQGQNQSYLFISIELIINTMWLGGVISVPGASVPS